MKHTHPILVFEDDMTLHRKQERDDQQCRPAFESAYDAKDHVVDELVDEGFEPCPKCMENDYKYYADVVESDEDVQEVE